MRTDPAAFFERLEASGLLTDSIAGAWPKLANLSSAEDAAGELVRQTLLTEFQADVLLTDESVPLVIGDYVVQDMIGRGGMGVVLKGRHQRMRRTVAIKFLLQSMDPSRSIQQRFEREVQAAAQLDHPNIVTAYDAGVHDDGSYYLVMQYVEGQDLSTLVKNSGPLPVSLALHLILQAAEGLAYAHEHGIVHRDVKPGNILLDHQGVVRVLDMGLARIRPTPGEHDEDGGAHADLTSPGNVMGTINYMAPEQALDARTADQRSDIYGLGCTLYFLLTGNPPYQRDTIMLRLLAHREDEIPPLRVVRPEVPQELDDVFARMLGKTQAERPASMRQLIMELERLNLSASTPDIMETLEQPVSSSDGSSIVFAAADEVSLAGRSSRPSESPRPGVAMKPKTEAKPLGKVQSEEDHPRTDKIDTGDTAFREKEKQQRRDHPKRKSASKSRKKSARRKRRPKPATEGQPVLSRGRSAEEAVSSEPKPRRSIKPLLLWLFGSSWGVPRVYFAGLAAICCLILAISLGPGSNETAPVDTPPVNTASDPSQSGDGAGDAPDNDYVLKFGQAGAVAEVDGIQSHGASPLTIEARITPEPMAASGRATILQISDTARLFIESKGDSWSLGCMLKNERGSSVESVSSVEHAFGVEHHVAAVWNLQTLKTYVDGNDERAWEFLPDPRSSGAGLLRVGAGVSGEMQFHGLIDELRVSDAIRYAEDFTVPRQHRSDEYTVALFHCDEGRGLRLNDSSANKSHADVTNVEWVVIRERPGKRKRKTEDGDVELQPVRELNSSATDGYCWLSPNGLTIYFTREGIPQSGVWKSNRITIAHQFAAPTFVTRVRQIALSGDETIAVAVMGHEKPDELAESSRRFFRQAPLDNFRTITTFSDSRSAQSPWLSRDGLTLTFQRVDRLKSYAGGSSPRSSRTEFVISHRTDLDTPWSRPMRLPLESSRRLTRPLTWPMMTDDGMTLLFCHGAGSDSEVMIASRQTNDGRFRNVRQVEINGTPLIGQAPRYVESTGELFVTRLHGNSETDWDLFVVPDFDVDDYR